MEIVKSPMSFCSPAWLPCLFQQLRSHRRRFPSFCRRPHRRYLWPRNRPFPQRRRAPRTHKLMKLTGRQYQQKPLTHRLRALTLWTIKLARGKISKLLFRHRSNFHYLSQNIKQDLVRRLVCVDTMNHLLSVKIQHRLRLPFVRLQAAADHVDVCIVQPVFL
jgi:hypothetical protein